MFCKGFKAFPERVGADANEPQQPVSNQVPAQPVVVVAAAAMPLRDHPQPRKTQWS
jgi:hypothetical protein